MLQRLIDSLGRLPHICKTMCFFVGAFLFFFQRARNDYHDMDFWNNTT